MNSMKRILLVVALFLQLLPTHKPEKETGW